MRCPRLSEIPPPPAGKTGWPWTEESAPLPIGIPGADRRPRITVVTPSFNQGRFLEETIRSVLLQAYPDLEYLVFDGGSTDNSVEIIRKYAPWIRYWASEPDSGQSSAINRGFTMGSGMYATWINSDDMLCKNALKSQLLARGLPAGKTVYIGECIHIDENGAYRFSHHGRVQSLEDLVRIKDVWRDGGSIDQPAVLFPLELALRVGGLNETNHNTMDYELWGKFLLAGAAFDYTGIPFGMFRCHSGQKTADSVKQTQSLLETAAVLVAQSVSMTDGAKAQTYADLAQYRREYPQQLWRHTGRLATLGIPRSIVMSIRSIKGTVQKGIRRLMKFAHLQDSM